MSTWLVINPNTSANVTQALLQHLGAGQAPGTSPGILQPTWQGITAPFGAPYIADERSYCIAGHAVLQAWEQAQSDAPPAGYAGVLVGCFGDPGVHALREVTTVPVHGLAEASLQALWAQGAQRVAIVTGGAAWQAMLQRWARAQNLYRTPQQIGPGICHIAVLPTSAGEMMAAPEAAAQALAHAGEQALAESDADAVLLGGAGLAGMGERVRRSGALPVWDCVELVRQALPPTRS